MQGTGEICPVPHLSSQTRRVRGLIAEKTECTWNRRTNIEHKEAWGTSQTSRDLLFSLSLSVSISVCLSISVPASRSSWLCSFRRFLGFFFFFLPTDEKKWKEHLHTWVNRARRCVGGELWESNRVSLSLCLHCSLSHSWGVFFFTLLVFVLETCGCAKVCVCVYTCMSVCALCVHCSNYSMSTAECFWLLVCI